MRSNSTAWTVVLAGGEGSRLKELTTTDAGEVVPKQFCSLERSTCLLEDALNRARAVASQDRICTVVAQQHQHWWRKVLTGLLPENVFVQPHNRGTANGILLALLQIERRDPDAVVTLLPEDHYVADEGVMARALRVATSLAVAEQNLVFLLGAEPDHADEELGYIVPSSRPAGGAAGVSRFAEKPSMAQARELIKAGALWNTFILAGSVRSLLSLYEGFDSTLEAMRSAIDVAQSEVVGAADLDVLYQDLKSCDFSRDVLERHEQVLQVLRVPPCGWTDLGTPKRLEEAIRELGQLRAGPLAMSAGSGKPFLDLAYCYRRRWLLQAS